MSKKSTEQKPEVATVALVQSAQEEEDTITSGNVVPIETTVAPIINSGI